MVLFPRIPAPDWGKGKCAEVHANSNTYDPFFEDCDEALVFCNGEYDNTPCPIRHECLLFALTNNEKFGIWGGTTVLTRKALRKRWPLQGKTPRPEWHWMTEEEAVRGLSPEELAEDDDEEDEEA